MFVLATSCAEPDGEFPTLKRLARHILTLHADATVAAGRDMEIRVGPAVVAREALPNGVSVAVRLMDGSRTGHLLGYAFLPVPETGFPPDMARQLRAALDAEAAPAMKAAA